MQGESCKPDSFAALDKVILPMLDSAARHTHF